VNVTREPWERRPDESPPAYEAFRVYLDAGPARSGAKVANELQKSRSLINRWSARHGWPDRAAAWESHLMAAYAAEIADARRTLAHRHVAVAREALEKVAAAVTRLDPADLSPSELARLWDTAATRELTALDLPTSRLAATVQLDPAAERRRERTREQLAAALREATTTEEH
jgi:hypothetical protein